MSGFKLQRLGMMMEPEPGNPQEVEGVLNPAAVRGPDGELYLFPRLVAKGNYSRIGIARVRFNEAGDPAGVERLGIALEPEADYERRPDGGGGCEDPRVTFVEPLQRYMMTYTAFSPKAHGSPWPYRRISSTGSVWGSRPLVRMHGIEFGDVDDKDASLFPVAIPNPSGTSGTGHAPPAALSRHSSGGNRLPPASRDVDLDRESIWISYCPMALEGREPYRLGQFTSHHRLATPVSPWERLKIGGGTPPILTRHGWLIIYHGVSEVAEPGNDGHQLCYSAGVMVLSKEHPQRDPLSFGGAGADAGAAAGTPRDRRQRRVSHRHRPARRSRLAGPFRRLLRDGRQPDRRGAPGRAGTACRPEVSCADLAGRARSVEERP